MLSKRGPFSRFIFAEQNEDEEGALQNEGGAPIAQQADETPPAPEVDIEASVAEAVAAVVPSEPPVAETEEPKVVPMAAQESRPAGRSSRVKTTFLGFDTGDDGVDMDELDNIAAEQDAAPAPAAPAAKRSSSPLFPTGWLVVVKGEGLGHCFALNTGLMSIGRSASQAICLNFGDDSISREGHANVAYDDHDCNFYIGHGGKANLVRLNGRPLLSTETFSHGDELEVGRTTLRLVALCSPDFDWKKVRNT